MSSDPEAAAVPPGRLLNVLGVTFGIAGAVGGTIGAGILRTPGLVAAQMGSGAWVVAAWLAGGLYALLGAVAAAELGASLPLAGGWYVYARRCFGDAAGFSVGWMDWIGHCTGIAWVAVTVGEYAVFLLPGLEGHGKLVGLAVLLLFTLIQLLGVEAGSGSQKLPQPGQGGGLPGRGGRLLPAGRTRHQRRRHRCDHHHARGAGATGELERPWRWRWCSRCRRSSPPTTAGTAPSTSPRSSANPRTTCPAP